MTWKGACVPRLLGNCRSHDVHCYLHGQGIAS